MDSTPPKHHSTLDESPISEQTLEIPNSTSGEHQRVEEEEEGKDRISSLPELVLGLILSKLPTKCAIATAVLSTKWRYLFSSIPNPRIFITDATEELRLLNLQPENNIRSPRFINPSFINFVSHLINHILPQFSTVEELHLSLYVNYGNQRIGEWFSTAPTCNVRRLTLSCLEEGCGISSLDVLRPFAPLLCSLSLSFRKSDLVAPQSTLLFPNLTKLAFSSIRFVGLDSFQRAVAACPELRVLILSCCRYPVDQNELHISVPSLANLTIKACYRHSFKLLIDTPALESLNYSDCITESYPVLKSGFPSLCAATFCVRPNTGQRDGEGQLGYTHYVANLLAACYNVKTIRFDVINLAFDIQDTYPMPSFRNMTQLNLRILEAGGWEALPKFLQHSPILQVLNLGWEVYSERVECYRRFQSHLPDSVPTCLTSHLSEIVFEVITGGKDEVKLVKYFLWTAQVLKKMKICFAGHLSHEEVRGIQKDILTSPICSTNCQIDIVQEQEE